MLKLLLFTVLVTAIAARLDAQLDGYDLAATLLDDEDLQLPPRDSGALHLSTCSHSQLLLRRGELMC